MPNIRKYRDAYSRGIAIKLLKVFSHGLKKLKDYKFDDSNPNILTFKFYVDIITHNHNFGDNEQILPPLIKFFESYKANGRMYVDNNAICIEIWVPRRTISGTGEPKL